MESFKPLTPVSRKILKDESQDYVHESDVNENRERNLKEYANISVLTRVALIKLVNTGYLTVNIQIYGVGIKRKENKEKHCCCQRKFKSFKEESN